jgi:hypothetical protein
MNSEPLASVTAVMTNDEFGKWMRILGDVPISQQSKLELEQSGHGREPSWDFDNPKSRS